MSMLLPTLLLLVSLSQLLVHGPPAQQPGPPVFCLHGRIELSGLAKMFLPSQPHQRLSLIPSSITIIASPSQQTEGHPFGCFALDLGRKVASLHYILWVKFEQFFYVRVACADPN